LYYSEEIRMHVDLRMIIKVKKHRSKASFFYFLENINLSTEKYSEHK